MQKKRKTLSLFLALIMMLGTVFIPSYEPAYAGDEYGLYFANADWDEDDFAILPASPNLRSSINIQYGFSRTMVFYIGSSTNSTPVKFSQIDVPDGVIINELDENNFTNENDGRYIFDISCTKVDTFTLSYTENETVYKCTVVCTLPEIAVYKAGTTLENRSTDNIIRNISLDGPEVSYVILLNGTVGSITSAKIVQEVAGVTSSAIISPDNTYATLALSGKPKTSGMLAIEIETDTGMRSTLFIRLEKGILFKVYVSMNEDANEIVPDGNSFYLPFITESEAKYYLYSSSGFNNFTSNWDNDNISLDYVSKTDQKWLVLSLDEGLFAAEGVRYTITDTSGDSWDGHFIFTNGCDTKLCVESNGWYEDTVNAFAEDVTEFSSHVSYWNDTTEEVEYPAVTGTDSSYGLVFGDRNIGTVTWDSTKNVWVWDTANATLGACDYLKVEKDETNYIIKLAVESSEPPFIKVYADKDTSSQQIKPSGDTYYLSYTVDEAKDYYIYSASGIDSIEAYWDNDSFSVEVIPGTDSKWALISLHQGCFDDQFNEYTIISGEKEWNGTFQFSDGKNYLRVYDSENDWYPCQAENYAGCIKELAIGKRDWDNNAQDWSFIPIDGSTIIKSYLLNGSDIGTIQWDDDDDIWIWDASDAVIGEHDYLCIILSDGSDYLFRLDITENPIDANPNYIMNFTYNNVEYTASMVLYDDTFEKYVGTTGPGGGIYAEDCDGELWGPPQIIGVTIFSDYNDVGQREELTLLNEIVDSVTFDITGNGTVDEPLISFENIRDDQGRTIGDLYWYNRVSDNGEMAKITATIHFKDNLGISAYGIPTEYVKVSMHSGLEYSLKFEVDCEELGIKDQASLQKLLDNLDDRFDIDNRMIDWVTINLADNCYYGDIINRYVPAGGEDAFFMSPLILSGGDNTTMHSFTVNSSIMVGGVTFIASDFDAEHPAPGNEIAVTTTLSDDEILANRSTGSFGGCTFVGYKTAIDGRGLLLEGGDVEYRYCGTGVRIYITGNPESVFNGMRGCKFINCETGLHIEQYSDFEVPYDIRVLYCDFIGNTTDIRLDEEGTFYFYFNYFDDDPVLDIDDTITRVICEPRRYKSIDDDDDSLFISADTTILANQGDTLRVESDGIADGTSITVVDQNEDEVCVWDFGK